MVCLDVWNPGCVKQKTTSKQNTPTTGDEYMTEEELKRESTDQKDVVLFERLIEIHLNYIKPQDFELFMFCHIDF